MDYQVVVERIEPQPMASVRRLTSQDRLSSVIPEALGVVWTWIRESQAAHLGINVCVYPDAQFNIECGVLMRGPFQPAGEVCASQTPGGLVARTIHLGPYSQLALAHKAIHLWCGQENLKLAGPSWEVYGHWNEDESQLRTDIFYLLQDQG